MRNVQGNDFYISFSLPSNPVPLNICIYCIINLQNKLLFKPKVHVKRIQRHHMLSMPIDNTCIFQCIYRKNFQIWDNMALSIYVFYHDSNPISWFCQLKPEFGLEL